MTSGYQPVAARPYNVLAVVGFVLAFVVPPGAIACGYVARAQIRATGEQGDGLALAALILGTVFTAVIALLIVIWLVAFVSIFAGIAGIASQIPAMRS